MKVLIVEDEKHAAENLARTLMDIDPGVEIMASIATVRDTVNWLEENDPELIFMDIHLSDGNSFRIFEQIEIKTPVIFTTAYDQYAIKAFKVNSIDYLLKPIEKKDLEKSLEKFEELRSSTGYDLGKLDALLESFSGKKEYRKRFMVYAGEKIKSVSTGSIAFFYILEKQVFLCTSDKRHYSLEFSLDRLEEMLDPDKFFRVSRRYIVNIDAIETMVQLSRGRIKIVTAPAAEEDILVSIHRIGRFKKWLNK